MADVETRLTYYTARADAIVDGLEDAGEREWRLVNALHLAGLPVATHPVASYWTWRERHLYTDDLRAWADTHKRQRTT